MFGGLWRLTGANVEYEANAAASHLFARCGKQPKSGSNIPFADNTVQVQVGGEGRSQVGHDLCPDHPEVGIPEAP